MTLLSMNEMTTYRWSFAQDVENYQQAGYGGIGVWRMKLSDECEDDAIDLIGGELGEHLRRPIRIEIGHALS